MKPLTIGIAGGSGSGKSTLSEKLKNKLSDYKVFSIHMDDYYYDPLPKMISPITQCSYGDWNHPDSLDYKKPLDLIKTLQSECSHEIIIVEGAFLYCYDEIRPLLDLKVFIDLDADARMYRRIKRYTQNFNRELTGFGNVDFQFDYYLHFAKFQEQKYALPSKIYADIILNGINLDGAAIDVLLSWIKQKSRE